MSGRPARGKKPDAGGDQKVRRRVQGPARLLPSSPTARVLCLVIWADTEPEHGEKRRLKAKLYDDTPKQLTGQSPPDEPLATSMQGKTISGCVADIARELHAYVTNELGTAADPHLGLMRASEPPSD